MYEVHQTDGFRAWLNALRDTKARLRIAARLRRVENGHLGDVKLIGNGVFELRLDFGPGYRIYFVKRGGSIVVLLCGGDKSSQRGDIQRAIALAGEV